MYRWASLCVAAAFAAIALSADAGPTTDLVETTVLTRQTGQPAVHEFEFVAARGEVTIEIDSPGRDGDDAVTSAVVTFNDVELADPDDFKNAGTSLTLTPTALAENLLEIELRGKPGSSLSVTVRQELQLIPLIVIRSAGSVQVIASIDGDAADHELVYGTSTATVGTNTVWPFDGDVRINGVPATGTYYFELRDRTTGDALSETYSVAAPATDFDVWMVDLDTRAHTAVAATAGQDYFPRFDPGGNRIAFQRDQDLRIKSLLTGAETTVYTSTNRIGYLAGTAWTPDGLSVIARDGPYNRYDLLQVSATPGGTAVNLTMNGLHHSMPDVSPLGTLIAGTYRTSPAAGATDRVYVMNPNGSGFRVLAPALGWTQEPRFSPDGSRILVNRSQRSLDVVNIDGSGHQVLYASSSQTRAPAWSPDGKEVLHWQAGDLWILNIASGARRRVTDVGGILYVQTDWSGRRVLFAARWSQGEPVTR